MDGEKLYREKVCFSIVDKIISCVILLSLKSVRGICIRVLNLSFPTSVTDTFSGLGLSVLQLLEWINASFCFLSRLPLPSHFVLPRMLLLCGSFLLSPLSPSPAKLRHIKLQWCLRFSGSWASATPHVDSSEECSPSNCDNRDLFRRQTGPQIRQSGEVKWRWRMLICVYLFDYSDSQTSSGERHEGASVWPLLLIHYIIIILKIKYKSVSHYLHQRQEKIKIILELNLMLTISLNSGENHF